MKILTTTFQLGMMKQNHLIYQVVFCKVIPWHRSFLVIVLDYVKRQEMDVKEVELAF